MGNAPIKFKHAAFKRCFINIFSWRLRQWPYTVHRSLKGKFFTCLCNRFLFIYITFVVRASAWLTTGSQDVFIILFDLL